MNLMTDTELRKHLEYLSKNLGKNPSDYQNIKDEELQKHIEKDAFSVLEKTPSSLLHTQRIKDKAFPKEIEELLFRNLKMIPENPPFNHQNIKDGIGLDYLYKWTPARPVFISAQTGSGKNYFIKELIKDLMLNDVYKLRYSFLILSNRVALRRQEKIDIVEYLYEILGKIVYGDSETKKNNYRKDYDHIEKRMKNLNNCPLDNIEELDRIERFGNITIKSYHGIGKALENQDSLDNSNYNYDFVIMDECHFFLADALFNDYTYDILNYILKKHPYSIRVYMTATPSEVIKPIIATEFNNIQQLRYDLTYDFNAFQQQLSQSTMPKPIPFQPTHFFKGFNPFLETPQPYQSSLQTQSFSKLDKGYKTQFFNLLFLPIIAREVLSVNVSEFKWHGDERFKYECELYEKYSININNSTYNSFKKSKLNLEAPLEKGYENFVTYDTYNKYSAVIYEFKRDYSYIDCEYLEYKKGKPIYENGKKQVDIERFMPLVNEIKKQIKDGNMEKWIIFSGKKIGKALEKAIGENVTYIDARSKNYRNSDPDTKEYKEYQVYQKIIAKGVFESKVLISTAVLDNGVNLVDSTLKHIAILIFDKVSFLQMLGRKRVEKDRKTGVFKERIKLYLPEYNFSFIKHIWIKRRKRLKDIEGLDYNYKVAYKNALDKNNDFKFNYTVDNLGYNKFLKDRLECDKRFFKELEMLYEEADEFKVDNYYAHTKRHKYYGHDILVGIYKQQLKINDIADREKVFEIATIANQLNWLEKEYIDFETKGYFKCEFSEGIVDVSKAEKEEEKKKEIIEEVEKILQLYAVTKISRAREFINLKAFPLDKQNELIEICKKFKDIPQDYNLNNQKIINYYIEEMGLQDKYTISKRDENLFVEIRK